LFRREHHGRHDARAALCRIAAEPRADGILIFWNLSARILELRTLLSGRISGVLRVTDFVAAAGSLALCCATGRGLVMGGVLAVFTWCRPRCRQWNMTIPARHLGPLDGRLSTRARQRRAGSHWACRWPPLFTPSTGGVPHTTAARLIQSPANAAAWRVRAHVSRFDVSMLPGRIGAFSRVHGFRN
jgi:hypothetical protein